MLPNNIERYLIKYSYGNYKTDLINKHSGISTIAVIPALAEKDNLPFLLSSLELNNNKNKNETLIIFVVNNTFSADKENKINNFETIEFLKNYRINSSLNIGIIDAATSGNEMDDKNGGVGLARKIGMDAALHLFDYSIEKKKILICLDADCTVSESYLQDIIINYNKEQMSAGYVQFEHPFSENEEISKAIICYEIFLRYYVLGLRFAKSHYAFFTIGSTMLCDVESYIKIEGMNKKKAAEDFYFLEKLAKHFNIKTIDNSFVYPSPRGSFRVPFGTGQRVNRYLSKIQNEYLLYNPDSFLILKEWLDIFHNNDISTKEYLIIAKEINKSLYEFLVSNKFESNWNKIISNSKNQKQTELQKKRWFDGFRTLKLIHYLRDNGFPPVNMFDAIDKLLKYHNIDFNIKRKEDIPSVEIQKEYLLYLRRLK